MSIENDATLDVHVGGMCPVQGEGEVDGHRWYFKARGQRWTLYVSAQPGGEPLAKDAWRLREPWGDQPFDAGYMPWDVAEGFVRAGLAKWRAEHPRCGACAEAIHTGGVWSDHTCGKPPAVTLVVGPVDTGASASARPGLRASVDTGAPVDER